MMGVRTKMGPILSWLFMGALMVQAQVPAGLISE
jgi:hypothetical protein